MVLEVKQINYENGMKINNLNGIFPENDKIHKIKTRAVVLTTST